MGEITRRDVMRVLGAVAGTSALHGESRGLEDIALKNSDAAVKRILAEQVTDPANRWCGTILNEYGFSEAGNAGGIATSLMAAFLHPRSVHYHDRELLGRIRLATKSLENRQDPQGFISLLATNFDSPPDTAFVVHGVAGAALLAQRAGERELFALMEPFLSKAGAGLAVGGVHTPNHRWVVSQALAQINEILPNPAYPRRIAQWLAEGIDIDDEGQYTEHSTSIYNTVVDRALTVLALKTNRPELLNDVRRNLDAMMYLLHPDYDVVTEISHRQDKDKEGTMGRYWFPLQLLAIRDGNGEYATIADHFADKQASLAMLMEYPELLQVMPALRPVPDDYEKILPGDGIARIRRGQTSATILLRHSSKLVAFRRGEAAVDAVRMASTYFGRGQFFPSEVEKVGNSYQFRQVIEAGYFQPLEPPRKVTAKEWAELRPRRRMTQICRLTYAATLTEQKNGFRMRMQAFGVDSVPMAVELGFGDEGSLHGCQPATDAKDAYVLKDGYGLYRSGSDAIRFGPGTYAHAWTQLRYVQPKLTNKSVYLTGFTPFDHTIEFEWA